MEIAKVLDIINNLKKSSNLESDISKIKNQYPFLAGYLNIKDTMKFTDDAETIADICESLLNDPHCPCLTVQNDNTLCPCLPCRKSGKCHCGLYEKK